MAHEYIPLNERIKKNNILGIIADEKHDKKLKQMHQYASSKVEDYCKGEEWYNSGFALEDASEELRNNTAFVNGYKRGERLAYIEQLKNGDNSRKSR